MESTKPKLDKTTISLVVVTIYGALVSLGVIPPMNAPEAYARCLCPPVVAAPAVPEVPAPVAE